MSRASDIERRIHAWMCAEITSRPGHARAGCFVAGFDPASLPFLNYAVPVENAEPCPADVAALERLFCARARTPRLEYIAAAAPAVEPALRNVGFAVEARLAVMAWQPDNSVVTQPNAFGIELAARDREIAEAAQVQSNAFGNGESDPSRLRRLVTNGGMVGVARDRESGIVVGVGAVGVPHDGVTETVYKRAGFVRVAEQLQMSKPGAA
ncbi:MAG: hypothetical protein ACREHF_09320 [Rhizomicrobium sp.]